MTIPSKRKPILICYGTRPEVIKLSPVIQELEKRGVPYKTLFTGQHNELFHSVKNLVPEHDFSLGIFEKNQTSVGIFSQLQKAFVPLLKTVKPAIVIVQGDTTSAAAVSLYSFYEKVAVGHVEAGLRTYDLNMPFPEEINRQLISRLATLHWAPTKTAAKNLRDEKITHVFVTGNTVIDICKRFHFPIQYGNRILVTLHRREHFGEIIKSLIRQLEDLAVQHPELEFMFPMHFNPAVRKWKKLLKHVHVIDPLPYEDCLKLLSEVKFVITDSGGLQEECAEFRKKVIVCRYVTERPEGVQVGLAKIVGQNLKENFEWANSSPKWRGKNPYGDGRASQKIVSTLIQFLKS